MSLIEVRDLTFEYPGKKALDKVSFFIESGSVIALVGLNGAVKPTRTSRPGRPAALSN